MTVEPGRYAEALNYHWERLRYTESHVCEVDGVPTAGSADEHLILFTACANRFCSQSFLYELHFFQPACDHSLKTFTPFVSSATQLSVLGSQKRLELSLSPQSPTCSGLSPDHT